MRTTAVLFGIAALFVGCAPDAQPVASPAPDTRVSLAGEANVTALANAATAPCTDVPPDGRYTCAQQAAWGKCGEAWMADKCNASCGRCGNVCTDLPPDNRYTCAQQAAWGKCGESWMQGYCNASCNQCRGTNTPPAGQNTPPASQNTPPASQNTPPASQNTPPASQNTPPANQNTPPPQTQAPKPSQPPAQNPAPAPAPAPNAPAQQRTQGCSLRSDTPAQVVFANHCPVAVSAIWVDFNCAEQNYGTVEPGQVLTLDTYLTHSWRVRVSATSQYLGDVPNLTQSLWVDVCPQ